MKRLLVFLVLISALGIGMNAWTEETPAPKTYALTEVEILKGQNIELQLRLLQEQFNSLQAQALTDRGLSTKEWTFNWPARRIDPKKPPQEEKPKDVK